MNSKYTKKSDPYSLRLYHTDKTELINMLLYQITP